MFLVTKMYDYYIIRIRLVFQQTQVERMRYRPKDDGRDLVSASSDPNDVLKTEVIILTGLQVP